MMRKHLMPGLATLGKIVAMLILLALVGCSGQSNASPPPQEEAWKPNTGSVIIVIKADEATRAALQSGNVKCTSFPKFQFQTKACGSAEEAATCSTYAQLASHGMQFEADDPPECCTIVVLDVKANGSCTQVQ